MEIVIFSVALLQHFVIPFDYQMFLNETLRQL